MNEPVEDGGAEPIVEREGGGPVETAVAAVICAAAMLLPIFWIQHRYEIFVSESGDIKEGAAGATLALAVVMRTVSRTVLRTIVRTSARAGIKASMRGAVHAGTRAASRTLFASLFKSAFGQKLTGSGPKPTEPAAIRKSNLKSLMFGSVLLYASWVIVIGLGQPFGELEDADQAAISAEAEAEAQREALLNPARVLPEVEAYNQRAAITEKKEALSKLRRDYKGARDEGARSALRLQLDDAQFELMDMQTVLTDLLVKSGGKIRAPLPPPAEFEPTAFDDAVDWLYTYAPFPGEIDWGSPVIWAGGVLWVLPLWFIYGVQARKAGRMGKVIRHETGVDGGFIQLYFAGAFSFMPLTSDVVVEGTAEDKGRVSAVGLIVPTCVSILLWLAWKLTGGESMWILLASDAFLIYPMVQTFPLAPLDGVQVWRWSHKRWFAIFFFVMTAFMLMGSEGLKNVI